MASCSVQQLQKVMECRHGDALSKLEAEFSGVNGLCARLQTSPENGLNDDPDDLARRRAQYGENAVRAKDPEPYWRLVLDALNDATLLALLAAALVSVALSFYHTDVTPSSLIQLGYVLGGGEAHGWIDGVAILAAVVTVVNVTAYNDWRKERQFRALHNRVEAEQLCSVLRGGKVIQVQISALVVGDVCLAKYGDVLPADGVLLHSNDLRVDEASLTGESDLVQKSNSGDVLLFSGTCIMEGSGRFLVTAVGPNSQAGIIMTLLNGGDSAAAKAKKNADEEQGMPTDKVCSAGGAESAEEEEEEEEAGGNAHKGRSLLQTKLTRLAIGIGYVGITMATLTILILSLRFSIDVFVVHKVAWDYGYVSVYVNYLINGIVILVIAIPEGLPLAVTIALAYSVGRMLHDNNLVRHLGACETMGNATTICSDKTGTLTTNRMTVVATYICEKFSATRAAQKGEVDESIYELLVKAVSLNCAFTSDVAKSEKAGEPPKQLGNKTECALLGFVLHLGDNYERFRKAYPESSLYKVFTFNSARKSMSTVIKKPDGGFLIFTKGASEIILKKCTYLACSGGKFQPLNERKRVEINRSVIEKMASNGLRTIGVAYREYASEPDWNDELGCISGLTLLAIFGIEDPVRPEVPGAIAKCQRAGVTVRMVTGDNVQTARSIAAKCGILSSSEQHALVLESAEFNKLIRDARGNVSQSQFDSVWPRLRVLARSTPKDKYTLVKHIIASRFSKKREVVAVTGDGTNDGPALKMADVGFAMGITGTDVAKEASDIILTDDNFSSIVQALKWGRNVYDSIAKFIQFQLTVNIVAVIVGSIGSMTISESPLQTLQMLWVNMIMDTLAALCLATEPPTDDLLNRQPYGRTSPIISKMMLRGIACMSVYQVAVIFALIFRGANLLDIDSAVVFTESGTPGLHSADPTEHFTFVFNTFVIMTMFNEINCRKIHGERNVLRNLHKNILFIAIWIGTIVGQALIVEFGGLVFKTTGLGLSGWAWSVFFGTTGMIWNQIVLCIPVRCGKRERATVGHEKTVISTDKPQTCASIELDISEQLPTTPGKTLWIRGLGRLRTQLDVIHALETQATFRRSHSLRSQKTRRSVRITVEATLTTDASQSRVANANGVGQEVLSSKLVPVVKSTKETQDSNCPADPPNGNTSGMSKADAINNNEDVVRKSFDNATFSVDEDSIFETSF